MSSASASARRNKACQACRQRKVKCDGLRPRCAICQSLAAPCHYETDRRQTSRISKEHFNLMGQKVANLENILAGITDKHGHKLSHSPSEAPVQVQQSTVPQHEGNDVTASDPAGNTLTIQQRRSSELQDISSPTAQSQPSEVPVHTLVHSDTGRSIHGPASAFHAPLSARSQPSLPSVAGESDSSVKQQADADDHIRRELFAFSAMEFQKEYTYMAERKIDLDGLDWETADHLFQLHWNHHHLGFLLTYRPAIMHSLATGGPHCNKLLLNAIYYTAALQSSRDNMRDDPNHPEYLGSRFFQRFQSLIAPEIQTSSTATIAALISMGSSCVSNGRQTIGWLYAGIAYQMIVDLGLHVDPNKVQMSSLAPTTPLVPLTAVDIEIQRRYTWGAFINDRFQSLYFGRPPSLRMIEGIEQSQTLLDNYEELEIWRPYIDPTTPGPPTQFIPQPARAITTWTALVRLAEIANEIVDRFYVPKARKLDPELAHTELQRLQQELDNWAEVLPEDIRFEPGQLPVPPPIRLNLHTTYSLLHILLHRPFLREGHLEALSIDEPARRRICVAAALRIYNLVKIYRETFTLRRATYLFSYAVFSAATILPLHSSPDSEPQEQMEIVVFFWNSLKELQNGANFGLRKTIRIIGGMFERAGIDLSALPTQDSTNNCNSQHMSDGVQPSALQDSSLPSLPESSLDILADGSFREFYNDIYEENIDWSAFIDAGNHEDNREILYGLFRPCNENDDGVPSMTPSLM